MRVRGRTRSEVDRVDPLGGELRDRRPRLLRLHRRHEPAQSGKASVAERRRCRRRVGEDLDLAAGHERADPIRHAGNDVACVQLDRRRRRDHVRSDAALDTDRADDLAEDEPVDLDVVRLLRRERLQPARELVDRVDARPGACRMRALAVERDARLQVAETAGVQLVVGRLEHDREVGVAQLPGGEERR